MRFQLECPRCDKRSEIESDEMLPRTNCGDCLMNDVEIVQMKVTNSGPLGYTEHETGYRHGKRDFAAGLRSPALMLENNEYAAGYRAGLQESIDLYRKHIEEQDETR